MKTKFNAFLLAILPLSLINANELLINNLTPENVPQNPSEIYSINVEISPMSSNIHKDLIKPSIVIDGKTYPMTKGSMGPLSFTYDYKMPSGANTVRYYFDVDYTTKVFETETKERKIKSNIYDLHLINRYTSSLDVSRGPIGATIAISGRGLSRSDTILFEDTKAQTTYISPNLLTFQVPALPAGKIYDVYIQGNNGTTRIGEFKIDAPSLHVNTHSIFLKTSEHTTFTLEIDNPAPKGGLVFDITTDIPESIIMDDVTIPHGQKTIDITIEGAKPASGSLFISADNFSELTIPVAVIEDKSIDLF